MHNRSIAAESNSPRTAVRILIFLALVGAIVVLMFATGWADKKAPAGSKGRVPVTATSDAR
jgi:hypothetical protein